METLDLERRGVDEPHSLLLCPNYSGGVYAVDDNGE
jgi:hypothetical protein